MSVIGAAAACPGTGAPLEALLPVVGASTLVPVLDGTSRTYANLYYAASAPALEAVAARVKEVLPLCASVHRGAGYLSQVSTALYEESRQATARFVADRVFEDSDTTAFFTAMARKIVYELARDAGQAS